MLCHTNRGLFEGYQVTRERIMSCIKYEVISYLFDQHYQVYLKVARSITIQKIRIICTLYLQSRPKSYLNLIVKRQQ